MNTIILENVEMYRNTQTMIMDNGRMYDYFTKEDGHTLMDVETGEIIDVIGTGYMHNLESGHVQTGNFFFLCVGNL